MEQQLKALFDYQRYSQNKELKKAIREVEEKYENSPLLINDEALSFAAGGRFTVIEKKNDENDNDDPIIKKKDSGLL